MKSKLLITLFAFLAAVVVKADGIEIDSIRHPLIMDSETDAPMVNQLDGSMPSRLRKEAAPKSVLKAADGENFNLVTTGTFTSIFFSYSDTAELRQSDKNPNRFLITPFIDSEDGIIVEITNKKSKTGAHILKVESASTGYEYLSYGMVSAKEAGGDEISCFDGTEFRLYLQYYVSVGYFASICVETFKIPEGLVTFTEDYNDGILFYAITDTSSREMSVVGLKDTERTALDIPGSVIKDGETYSITSIGDGAFVNCSGLTSITIPNSVTMVGNHALYGCLDLTSIIVDSGNRIYDSRENCNAIIETEHNKLIYGCMNTIIPNSVTSIGEAAFDGCTGLTSVSIPSSVISIGNDAFADCSGLASIVLSNSVTSIGEASFYGCTSLTNITLPNSVTQIGVGAFAFCSSLMSIDIPNSVTSIGVYVFTGCSALNSITVDKGNKVYDSRENCNAIIETENNKMISGCKNTVIPNSVTSIGETAFAFCSDLTRIDIPNSVTSIENDAFRDCVDLIEINIPNSVINIGNYAFNSCYALTSINIPSSVTTIGDGAFGFCYSLISITISNSVTSIGRFAFCDCYHLKDVYAYRTNAGEYNAYLSAFDNCFYEDITLHVPTGCRESYANLAPWSYFGTIVDDIETAIAPIELNSNAATYYNPLGQQFKEAQRGVNIIRFSDGTTKKVLVK